MHKRLVTRYAMKSPEAADENQQRIERVFEELAAAKPDTVSYIVLRLADDSFVHVSFHNHGEDEANPIASTAALSASESAIAGAAANINPIAATQAAIVRRGRLNIAVLLGRKFSSAESSVV